MTNLPAAHFSGRYTQINGIEIFMLFESCCYFDCFLKLNQCATIVILPDVELSPVVVISPDGEIAATTSERSS